MNETKRKWNTKLWKKQLFRSLLTYSFKDGFKSLINSVSFILQWDSDCPLAKILTWSHFKMWPDDLTWSASGDIWWPLIRTLKCSLFLSWRKAVSLLILYFIFFLSPFCYLIVNKLVPASIQAHYYFMVDFRGKADYQSDISAEASKRHARC